MWRDVKAGLVAALVDGKQAVCDHRAGSASELFVHQVCPGQVCIKPVAEGSESRKSRFRSLSCSKQILGQMVVGGDRTKWPADHCHGIDGHNPALRGLS